MGTQNTKIDNILYYYVFQKKINNYLNHYIIRKDKFSLKDGYIISPDWIKEWKMRINYNKIVEDYLDYFNLNSTKLNEEQKMMINQFIESDKNLNLETKTIIKYSYFINLCESIIMFNDEEINETFLKNFVNKKTFEKLEINDIRAFEKVKYIFKEKIFILFIEKNYSIKILFLNIFYKQEKYYLFNLTLQFLEKNEYQDMSTFLEKSYSDKIINFFSKYDVFEKKYLEFKENDKIVFIVKNKNYKEVLINIDKDKNFHHQEDESTKYSIDNKEIKKTYEINFNLINRINYKGLDNVGANCYMNAILQCLANIKPITDYLLKQKHYEFLYQNYDICRLTMQYIQVLIGLFCSESTQGSYSPENFKNIIYELNPLFRGVQANDSKDLIIFILEIMNKELVKINNIKYNINNDEDESYQKIDTSDEKMVLNYFLKDFKKKYCSIIGNYFIGFNKSIFVCQNCNGKIINFNFFNILNFCLEEISNYFNLGYNNNSIPIITFDNCFNFLSKEQNFKDTYCQKCGKVCVSKYREIIFSLPLYLIIILNRGKENIFNCNVKVPEKFNASNYIDKKNQNADYELIGIVSNFCENGMKGNFIAFCKHNIDGKWRCYDDSDVTECSNDYLTKGTPYILFYKKI